MQSDNSGFDAQAVRRAATAAEPEGRCAWFQDQEKLTVLAKAGYLNACALLADADVMLSYGRWPRGHFLSAIALEELARAQMLLVFDPDDVDLGPEPFQPEAVGEPGSTAAPEGEAEPLGFTVPFVEALIRCAPAEVSLSSLDALLEVVQQSEAALLQGLSVGHAEGEPVLPEAIGRFEAVRLFDLVTVAFEATSWVWRRDEKIWARVHGEIPAR
ncbi:AbiV family abortive infection protein [Kitasatospora sp. NPDC093102]|uniref:AbiV family abortive infection protein n=1 Tax=Kitasatospora sp. NPDC093102 TaxID=3155069 RepID=UPI003426B216